MIRKSRWLKDSDPAEAWSSVASRAVASRLRLVAYYLPRAAKHSAENTEYVHQLRVATRRCRAALDIFRDLLPAKRARWIRKQLRRIRRAAADARDLDVLGTRLAEIAATDGDHGFAGVRERIAQQRNRAQKPLRSRYGKFKRAGFSRRGRALVKRIRWRDEGPEPCFAEAARSALRPLLDSFFQAAVADLSDVRAMHRMRICGKQVRYAMELMAGAFDETFRSELYPIFEEVQERLGVINDHATADVRFRDWHEQSEEGAGRQALAELAASEKQQAASCSQDFLQWWTPARAADLQRRFDQALGDHPSTGGNGRSQESQRSEGLDAALQGERS